MKKISCLAVFLTLALSGAHVFAGDVDTPSFRLFPTKIPKCAKAFVCQDLQYGGRQVGKGTEQGFVVASMNYVLCNPKREEAHTFAEMLADIDAMISHPPVSRRQRESPTGSVKTNGTFKRAKDGKAKAYSAIWKLAGSNETPPESVGTDGIVATQNYVTLTNGLTAAGVPFAARLEPYPHCKILTRKPETRQWLYENLRKYLRENAK